jgi:hypothetical protein
MARALDFAALPETVTQRVLVEINTISPCRLKLQGAMSDRLRPLFVTSDTGGFGGLWRRGESNPYKDQVFKPIRRLSACRVCLVCAKLVETSC